GPWHAPCCSGSPMRAERTDPAGPPSRPRQPFPKVPARPTAPGKPVAQSALASRGAAHATTAQALQRAQVGHAANARELQRARVEHAAHVHELADVNRHTAETHRSHEPPSSRGVRERLAQALEQSPIPQPPAPTAHAAEPGDEKAHPSRVESAMKLVERIEVFLRSGRPQLELSAGGAFQAEVLLERTGPREVAVTVRGKNGP